MNSGFSPTKGLMQSLDKYLITISLLKVQMIKCFLNYQYVSAISTPQEFRGDFIEFLDDSHGVVGSVATTFRESFVWPPSHSSDLSLNFDRACCCPPHSGYNRRCRRTTFVPSKNM